MPLTFAKEPAGGLATISNVLMHMAGKPLPITRVIVDPLSHKVVPAFAIQVFQDIRQIANGGGMETLSDCAYRYNIMSGSETINIAEVTIDANGHTQFYRMGHGKSITEAAEAFVRLATLNQVQKNSFQASLFWCDPINFAGIWLKSTDAPGQDYVYTFGVRNPPLSHVLKKDELYTTNDFIKIIRPLVAEKLIKDAMKSQKA